MRECYTYEISTMQPDGRWRLSRVDTEYSARNPESVARSLLERWIIGNRDKLAGGERIIVPRHGVIPGKLAGKVRVQVFRGGRERRPAAVAYLAHALSDYPEHRPTRRLRRRIRLARARTKEPDRLSPVMSGRSVRPLGDAA